MLYSEHNWKSHDGLNLFARSWRPVGKRIRGVICFVHGLGEHSGRYSEWALKFVEEGFAVTAFDYRGHGKSDGKRGHTPSCLRITEDIQVLLNQSEILFPGIPKVLYGHSLGGNLALQFMLDKTPLIYGLIITSPWLELSFQPPKWKVVLGKRIQAVWPGLSQSSGLKTQHLSHNQGVVEEYSKDPLVHGQITAKLFHCATEGGKSILAKADQLYVQTLLLHGSKDYITSPDASRRFAEASSKFTEFKLFEGLFHELHNEDRKDEVFAVIVKWLEKL